MKLQGKLLKRNVLSLMLFSKVLSGCAGEQNPTFSLLPGEASFKQSSVIDNKIDIVWVVDNSGSMANLQSNIAANFQSFIQNFVNKDYDFKIAVTNTEAWRADFLSDPSLAEFKDGDGTNSSGVKFLTPDTPDLVNNFLINIQQGTSGYGDERPFQSLKQALESPLNRGFRREGAFLAVIIVTDEEDFSHDGSNYSNEDYNFPGLHTVESYKTYLDNLTNSTEDFPMHSVSAISIQDASCLASNTPYGNIATRVQELVSLTDGVQGDVCSSNFSDTLDAIQDQIAVLSTQFLIDRELLPNTLKVSVNGQAVSKSAENGWSYNESNKTLRFHGSAIPPQGADISIQYEPLTIKN